MLQVTGWAVFRTGWAAAVVASGALCASADPPLAAARPRAAISAPQLLPAEQADSQTANSRQAGSAIGSAEQPGGSARGASALGASAPGASALGASAPRANEPGANEPDAERALAERLAAQVTIYRDAYGVPHVDGQSDEAALFGFAYAQAEDYFWQVEDNYILALGRYAEVHGTRGLNSDLLNRAFEIVPRARLSFAALDAELRSLCGAFTAGLNYYLALHPQVKPRLIAHFEPWQVLAYGRHITLEMCFRRTGLSNTYLPRAHDRIWAASGSNGWAIAPGRTKSGHAMLLANPHLPWFGFSQLFEAHVRSQSNWDFTGATTYGSPVMILGHNAQLGWTLTTNEPDIADLWRVEFDDAEHPLNYRYGDGYRTATQWQETIGVLDPTGVHPRSYTLRKTHYGPVVAQEDPRHFLSARIAGMENTQTMRQSIEMMRAQSFPAFRKALDRQQFSLMNIVYADRDGNIFYLYNGLIPRRDGTLDHSLPLDGADERTAWQGLHSVDQLPQLLNPADGYVQNCNSSPYTTCSRENPSRADFPRYMAEDAGDDKRRAQRSRQMLDALHELTFEQLQEAAFDTTVYWAKEQLPRYAELLEKLKSTDPALAAEVQPYLDHLLAWDGRITADSTAATLCDAWYTELYGREYPGETLKRRFVKDPERQFRALLKAASGLQSTHGKWRVPWGEVFRVQRAAKVADLIELPLDDREASLRSLAGPGPMGVIFTQYYSPSLRIPFFRTIKGRYALIGPSYLGVYEFGPQVRGATAVYFGASGDPQSPHFADQAELMSQQRLKRELFDWQEIAAAASEKYHPGQQRP